jgi:thymidylate kinase
MLITFSGLDGSGKSSLIEFLKISLEERNQCVAVFHMEHEVGLYAYLQSIRDLISPVTTQRADRQPKRELERSSPRKSQTGRLKAAISHGRYTLVWNKPLRRCVYLVDLLIFLFYRLYVEKIKKQILIMDRYFYDRLVDVAIEKAWHLKLLALLTPTPTLPFYLDISAEEAYARKAEFSVEYLRKRRAAYQRVFPLIPSSIVVTSGNDLGTTARSLEEMVMERTCR